MMLGVYNSKNPGMKKESGFSLIEMSVVLTVVAMIAGTALATGAASLEVNRARDTRERMTFIMEMLEKYVIDKHYLPCPARSDLIHTDADFGVGQGTGVAASLPAEECVTVAGEQTGAPDHIVAGMVPFKTLRISPRFALDAWNRRMLYVVDHNMTWDGAGGFTDAGVNGNITISYASGSPIITDAAVALVSFGSNGQGAWVARGGSRIEKYTAAAPPSLDEQENGYNGNGVLSNVNDTLFDSEFVQKAFATRGAGNVFDDVVEYRTKWQLQ